MTNAIETEGLTKDYGQHRGIFDLNLEVSQTPGDRVRLPRRIVLCCQSV
jgi:hypothetical protein